MKRLGRPSGAIAALLAALVIAGCGGGDSDPDGSVAEPSGALPPGHGSVAVIDAWAEALAEGNVEGAADLFRLPSVVQNGTPPLLISTHRDALEFNHSLPCGATLVEATPSGGAIAATFRLKERPGGDCGSGAGALARTAFVIRKGKITEWRRLPDPGEPAPSGSPA